MNVDGNIALLESQRGKRKINQQSIVGGVRVDPLYYLEEKVRLFHVTIMR